MFDPVAFKQKTDALNAALPAIAALVQTAQVIAPASPGLSKAAIVVNTLVAVEPALSAVEQVLSVAVTGVVNAYRADGTLPPAKV